MEEKKKRWRPSLTAYRELENLVSELKEENARLISKDESDRLKDKISVLEKSNKLLEEECDNLRGKLEEAGSTIDAMDKEIFALCHRSLWARIFNK